MKIRLFRGIYATISGNSGGFSGNIRSVSPSFDGSLACAFLKLCPKCPVCAGFCVVLPLPNEGGGREVKLGLIRSQEPKSPVRSKNIVFEKSSPTFSPLVNLVD